MKKTLETVPMDCGELVDRVRSTAPASAHQTRLGCLFYEFGPESTWGSESASGDYVSFPDGPFGSEGMAQSQAVSALIDHLSLARPSVAAKHGGQMPNVLEAVVLADGAALCTWSVDAKLDANWLDKYRQDMGEKAYQEFVRGLEAQRQGQAAPASSQEAEAPQSHAAVGLHSTGELLGHIVAEVGDSAPAGWSEWIMDGQVAQSGQGAQLHTELTASYWVRVGKQARLKPFAVRNVVGPLNALQDLQQQLKTPAGAAWHTLRIRYVAGAGSTDITFDPPSPPADTQG